MRNKSKFWKPGILCLIWLGMSPVINGQESLELDNDTLHVKLDLTRGGAINYVSVSGSERNLVNIHDEGRYIQQSYYAGQTLNRQADGQNPNWSPWPWNPIQVGDSYNNRAEILDQSNDGITMYTKCIPMLWDMNNEPAAAEMEQWTTLMGNVIKVHNKITCLRTDNIWEEGLTKDQELPAVYPIADLKNLYSYFGNYPFTGGPLNNPEVVFLNGPTKFWGRYGNNMVSENWMAFVDDTQWGMGVYTPISNNFLAGMAGTPGGGALSGSTSYIAPVKRVEMNKNTVYEYDYWLVIGTLNQIRSEIYSLKGVQKNAWEFTDDLEGWNVDPNGGTVVQSEGKLTFTVSGENPSVDNLVESWNPADFRYLWLSIKNETAGDSGAFHLFSNAGGADVVTYPLIASDTEFRDVLIDLDTMGVWTGDATYNRFRLEPVSSNDPGTVSVDFIRFLESLIQVRSEGNTTEIIGLGSSLQLYAELIPDMSAIEVDWMVDHPMIASISESGYLTAVSEGIVTVIATAKDGSGMPASLNIEIIDDRQRSSWEFISDEEGWDKNPHACSVSHSEGALKVTVENGDPYVANNVDPWEVGKLKYLWMRVKNETSGNGGSIYLFPKSGDHDNVPYPLVRNDIAYRDVFIDMRSAQEWIPDQIIATLRLDANNGGEPGDIYFDFIRFKEELVAVTSEGGLTEIEGPGNTLQLYTEVLIEVDPVEFEWSVDKPEIATVDSNGLLTSISEGTVVVTASDKDNSGIAGEISISVTLAHTNIEQTGPAQMRIYPNPANELIQIANASEINRVTIINNTGQLVMEISNTDSHISLNIESLQSGVYLLRATSIKGSTISTSFIIR
ncbi:MAG: T9SS type A sorting domain-containing protein [Bacteroidetes bacterium]|nr:T9SS type A sorting domain-containing protein [Bacteroidota bacterium]